MNSMPRIRRWRSVVTILTALSAAFGFALWELTAPRPAVDEPAHTRLDRPGDVDHGRLVFAAGDCASCHASPNQPDPLRLGGGLALASPYGTLRAPNISQDPVDGIGRWSTADLANALLSGVSPASRHYYPVFPYASYAHMRIDDVVDLMAYLRTLPPVVGRAPPHELTFPFNIRRGIGIWKLLYFDRSPISDDPARPAAWNRGRYLVDSLSHCAECHSSRNLLGAIKEQTRFAGGRDSQGTGFVPNITPEGIGDWSVEELAQMLGDGRTPDLRTAGSSMAAVVANLRSLPETDRMAIAVYVKTLAPRPTATP
jgi:mono/diheme cytochrome c family protein